MKTETPEGEKTLVFHNVTQEPFAVSGFPWLKSDGSWNRVPESIMSDLPKSLAWVAPQPSGGMIRFCSDSPQIAVRAQLDRAEKSSTVTPAALSGFCLYEGVGQKKHFAGLLAPSEPLMEYEAVLSVGASGMREWTLYTPLQNPIKSVEIGLAPSASLSEPARFSIAKPILFYGSSITCGFCASRPGLTYPARICRELDAPLINLGFGGNAKGEPIMAETIAALEIACFVMDYDHNAPDADHLRRTHHPFFQIIREAQPDLPIVIVSSPSFHSDPGLFGSRRDAIIKTFLSAKENKDQHVWFVDGETLFRKHRWEDDTIDRLHPNDAGFHRMAEGILPAIKAALSSGC